MIKTMILAAILVVTAGAVEVSAASRRPARLPTIETYLLDIAYSHVDNTDWFSISETETGNSIHLNFVDPWLWRTGPTVRRNHVEYPLHRINDIEFRASLNPPTSANGELVYRIFGGNRLLYTSPVLTRDSSPARVELDIRPHASLRIELEMRHTGGRNTIFHFDENYLGIENAVIISVEGSSLR